MFPNLNGSLMRNGFSFLKSVNYAGILDGASKTLNVVNQAIPVYYQVKPIISNLHILKNIQESIKEEPIEENHSSPIFYI